MPFYEFIAKDGSEDRCDIFMEYDDAVDIGATIERDGRLWCRIPSLPVAAVKSFKAFVSYTQPPVPAGVDPATSGIIADRWERDPESGEQRAVYTSEETARRNASASKDAGNTYLTWDE